MEGASENTGLSGPRGVRCRGDAFALADLVNEALDIGDFSYVEASDFMEEFAYNAGRGSIPVYFPEGDPYLKSGKGSVIRRPEPVRIEGAEIEAYPISDIENALSMRSDTPDSEQLHYWVSWAEQNDFCIMGVDDYDYVTPSSIAPFRAQEIEIEGFFDLEWTVDARDPDANITTKENELKDGFAVLVDGVRIFERDDISRSHKVNDDPARYRLKNSIDV